MNHSDVRDEQQHALILQLTAERDALKAELKLEQESRISRRLYEQDTECLRHDRNVWKNRFEVSEAENQRLRAEAGAAEALEEHLQAQLTELREAAEAVRTHYAIVPHGGPVAERFCAVLAKVTPAPPPPCTCRFDRSDHGWVSKTPCKLHGQKGTP